MHLKGDEAEFHYREAIRIYKYYTAAYINLGTHLGQARRPLEAAEVFTKGLESYYAVPLYSIDVSVLYRNLGQCYLDSNQIPKALDQYEACLQAQPTNSFCLEKVRDIRAHLQLAPVPKTTKKKKSLK